MLKCDFMIRKKIIDCETIYLSNLMKKDLIYLKKWRNSQTLILRQNKKLTNQDQKKWWEKIKKSEKENLFAIINTSEKLIGYCGLTNIDKINSRSEISFLLNPEINEKSKRYEKIFTEVIDALCKYNFLKLKMNKIYTETYIFRKKHILIIEKFGFKKEGELREHIFKKSKFYNSLIHSMLKKEYKVKK